VTTTPTVWLPEFQANPTTQSGNQSSPQSIVLRDGRILTVWADDGNTAGTSAGTDLVGQFFDVKGSPLKQPFQINVGFTVNDESQPVIAALPDGGFIVVYQQLGSAPGENAAIRFDRYNSHGIHITGKSVDSGTIGGSENASPKVTVLADGSIAVTYERTIGGNTDVVTRIIDSATNTVGTRLQSGGNDASDDEGDADFGQLTDGNLVTVYERNDGTQTSVEFKVITLAGVISGSVTEISADGHSAHVAALSGGGFVLTWIDNVAGGLRSEVRDNSGAVITGSFEVEGTSGAPGDSDVVALKDGGYFVVWKSGTANALLGQRFSATGTLVGNEITISTGSAIDEPSISLSGDGRILVTFIDANGEVSEVILDPRGNLINGTAFRDALISRVEGATVNGFGGNDTIVGLDGDDHLNGGNNRDSIKGGAGADSINGSFGDDTLDGGAGIDTVRGGDGNDLFMFRQGDNSGNGHVVDGGSGVDTLLVHSSVDFTTTAFTSIEGLEFARNTGSPKTAIFLAEQIGNGLAADLAINGSGGRTDILQINMDTLDSMDFSNLVFTDFVFAGNEKDRVRVLGDNDNETINGSDVVDIVAGRGGDDQLSGGEGWDRLYGGLGDDNYYVDHWREAFERYNQGTDTVHSSVNYVLGSHIENLVLTSGGRAFGLGNSLANTIEGGDGNNILDGMRGNDTLTGGDGADAFRFSTKLHATRNVDVITDFDIVADRFRLDDAVFTGMTVGTLRGFAFHIGTEAHDANDRIIYDSASGNLYFDADGTGAGKQILFATLAPGLALAAGDFTII
jgi:Ca2+-binding RTX toxin-like protein